MAKGYHLCSFTSFQPYHSNGNDSHITQAFLAMHDQIDTQLNLVHNEVQNFSPNWPHNITQMAAIRTQVGSLFLQCTETYFYP